MLRGKPREPVNRCARSDWRDGEGTPAALIVLGTMRVCKRMFTLIFWSAAARDVIRLGLSDTGEVCSQRAEQPVFAVRRQSRSLSGPSGHCSENSMQRLDYSMQRLD